MRDSKQHRAVIARLKRDEPEDKIMSATGIDAYDLWAVRKNINENATPETTSKLKRDPLKNLLSRGVLEDCHLRAADRIREGFRLRTDGVDLRAASLEPRVDTSQHYGGDQAARDIRTEHNYLLWYGLCQKEMPYIQPEIAVESVTRLISLAESDREWGKAKGWSRDHLVRGLQLYCDRFG